MRIFIGGFTNSHPKTAFQEPAMKVLTWNFLSDSQIFVHCMSQQWKDQFAKNSWTNHFCHCDTIFSHAFHLSVDKMSQSEKWLWIQVQFHRFTVSKILIQDWQHPTQCNCIHHCDVDENDVNPTAKVSFAKWNWANFWCQNIQWKKQNIWKIQWKMLWHVVTIANLSHILQHCNVKSQFAAFGLFLVCWPCIHAKTNGKSQWNKVKRDENVTKKWWTFSRWMKRVRNTAFAKVVKHCECCGIVKKMQINPFQVKCSDMSFCAVHCTQKVFT